MSDWSRCYACSLPAVCFGADLAFPKYRCPIHCREDHVIDHHGDPIYMQGHANAEGVMSL